jgi:predicted transposase/invertase (TIGR01784 family)
MTNAELWAVFFQYLTDEAKKTKIVDIINHEEGIAMAVETLGRFTQNEIDYIRETSLLIGELDWNTGIHKAKKEGLKEGRTEATLENARRMKKMGFLTEQIQAVTELSTDTIAQL